MDPTPTSVAVEPPLRLYGYHRSSATYRVRIALHHKEVPFELVVVSIRAGEQIAPDHVRRNPLGQVPVIEVQHGGGVVHLAQSVAIIEYLDEVYPTAPLLPLDPVARARVRELSEIVNSGTQPLQNTSVLRFLEDEIRVDSNAWARRYIRRGLEALEARARVTAGAFLVGDAPTMADVCLVPQMFNARAFGVSLDGLDTLVRVDEACTGLPRWDAAHPLRQPDAV